MSSFIVSKAAYMRAAGLIAGIQDYKRNHLIYDYSIRNWMQPEDFMTKFSHFYDLNVLSVIEQYNDERMQGTPPTEKECKRIFDEYRKKGRSLMVAPDTRKDLIMHLRNFFSCCEYQTEKEAYYFEMMMFFNRLLVSFMPYLHTEPRDGWSDLEFC